MRFLVLCLCIVAPPACNAADAYTMNRAVIGATGGTVSGGPFMLNFTAAQATTGSHIGANTNLNSGYWWTIDVPTDVTGEERMPAHFSVSAGSPNPFWKHMRVEYAIPREGAGHVVISIFDVQGRLIRTLFNGQQESGVHSVIWDGKNEGGQVLPAGVYFVRFQASDFTDHRRVVMLK